MIAFERQSVKQPVNIADTLEPVFIHSEETTLPYSAEQLFDLVADIERYPEFLPGWKSVSIICREPNELHVEQEFGYPLFGFKVNSIAELDRPRHIFIVVEDGPFKSLEIDWYFRSISSCKTTVSLRIKMGAYPVQELSLYQQFLTYTADSLLGYFERRANYIYGNVNTPAVNRKTGG